MSACLQRMATCAMLLLATFVPVRADEEQGLEKVVADLRKVVAEQQKLIAELQDRVRRLESTRNGETEEIPIPPVEIPEQTPATVSRPAPSSFMPDFAVIGNHRGTFLVPRGYDARNRFQLSELELALQQPIYTGMNFYATIAGGADAGFGMAVEEGYVTLSRPFKLPVDAVVGKRRMQFGKTNQLHPHQWRFVDAPAPIAAFLGEEGLFGNGASVNYTLPSRNTFVNLELGLWGASSAHPHEHSDTADTHAYELGAGFAGDMPVGRLWVSRSLSPASEVELGASHALGKGENGDPIRLTGLDLTYRGFPGTFSRYQAQGEIFWHARNDRTGGTGTHTRSGHFALLTYSPNQYFEYGLRYDNTRYPWPIEGRDQSLSLILTNRLSEATLVRLQYKFGDRTSDVFLPARRGYSEVFLQFIWGAGSHTHPLQ